MKKNSLVHGGTGFAIALASMLGMGSVSAQNVQAMSQEQSAQTPIKAPAAKQVRSKIQITNEVGGIPLASYFPEFGMTPKQYGQIYGNGGSKRSNRLRYSHNAKLRRRNA